MTPNERQYAAELSRARDLGELTPEEHDRAQALLANRKLGFTIPSFREIDGDAFAERVRAYLETGTVAPPAGPASTLPGRVVVDVLAIIAWLILAAGTVNAFMQFSLAADMASNPLVESSMGITYGGIAAAFGTAVMASVLLFGLRAIIQLLQISVTSRATDA